jgi:hypothetical protein
VIWGEVPASARAWIRYRPVHPAITPDSATWTASGAVQSYDASPDDKRFVILRETAAKERSEFIVVENLSQELRARTLASPGMSVPEPFKLSLEELFQPV